MFATSTFIFYMIFSQSTPGNIFTVHLRLLHVI